MISEDLQMQIFGYIEAEEPPAESLKGEIYRLVNNAQNLDMLDAVLPEVVEMVGGLHEAQARFLDTILKGKPIWINRAFGGYASGRGIAILRNVDND